MSGDDAERERVKTAMTAADTELKELKDVLEAA